MNNHFLWGYVSYMKRLNSVCLFLIFFMATALLTGCGEKGINTDLRDLGGVYSSSYDKENFSIEVSGRLSENPGTEVSVLGEEFTADASLNQPNKLLRWGIKRNPDNKTPDADPGAPDLLKKYGGVYLGDTSRKIIYLTFDEGYENGYTAKILDTLRNNNVKGVFFITGPYLKDHQDLVRRMVEEGHYVGNHTIHHPSLPTVADNVIEEEVLGLDRAFFEKFNQHMKFLRPPKGEYSERSLEITSKLGYVNMFWSFAYDDWFRDKIRGAAYAHDIVMRNLHNGAVLLLHAVSKDNADALDSIIKDIVQQGYTIGDPIDLITN